MILAIAIALPFTVSIAFIERLSKKSGRYALFSAGDVPSYCCLLRVEHTCNLAPTGSRPSRVARSIYQDA
jgi:hypothetical protein